MMKLSRALIYVIVIIFIGWCAFTFRSDIAQIKFAPVRAAWDSIFFALLLSLVNYALRVARWALYLSNLGHHLPFSFSGLTYIAGFAFTLSPGKVGEMVRSRYYQKIGIPLTSTAAAFLIERLMDLLAMFALAFMALASSATTTTYDDALILGAAIVITLLMAILAVSSWVKIYEYVEKAHWFPESIKKPVREVFRTLCSAKALLKPKLLAASFIIGLIAWGAEGTGLMVIGVISPSISIDWATAIGIYSIAIIIGALSFLPGGLGSTEAVMIALLAAHGYSMPDAILLTVVCRLLTLWFAVVIGWIAVGVMHRNPMLEEISQ
jgi:uncharacterized protein (TIRG00374 family)